MVDITKKIRAAAAYLEISQAELARRLNMSPAAFNQRMKTGKWSSADLEHIASALGAEFVCSFVFPDGQEI